MTFRFTVSEPAASEPALLPVCAAPTDSANPLVGDDGGPVWPVRTAADRSFLKAVAKLFGGDVHDVRASEQQAESALGTVLGVGDTADETRLYASLTRRGYHMVPSVDDLQSNLMPDIVVATGQRLDRNLVRTLLTAPTQGHTTGIVWGRTRQELRRRVLAYSASALLNGPVSKRRLDVTPLGGRPGAQGRLDEDAPRETIANAAGEGAGLLCIVAHGNGLRVALRPELTLCAMASPTAGGDPSGAPACAETGFCSVHNMPLSERALATRLLSPESLSARILVLIACQSAFIGSRAVDPTWSLLPRLLDNPRIGAIITSPELLMTTRDSISGDLLDQLAAGIPAGRALVGYEESPSAQQFDQRLLLFGDPGVRAAPVLPGKPALRLSRRLQRTSSPAPPPMLDPKTGLLRKIAEQLRSDTLERSEATSHVALRALDAYESAPQTGDRVGDRQRLRSAVIDHLAMIKARAWTGWFAHAGISREREAVPCPYCAWPIRPFVGTIASGDRRFASCPSCGDIVDQPVESDMTMTTTLPRIELGGRLPTDDWTAAVVLIPDVVRDARVLPWPALPGGEPARTFEIPPDMWLAGPLSICLAIIDGLALNVLAETGRLRPS